MNQKIPQIRSVKIDIGRNKNNEVTARLSKSNGTKYRTKDQFWRDQQEHALKREQRLADLKEQQRLKWKELMPFQPQIDKVSKVLGEIQIQQKYSQRELKSVKDQQELENDDLKKNKKSTDGRTPEEAEGASERSDAAEEQDPQMLA